MYFFPTTKKLNLTIDVLLMLVLILKICYGSISFPATANFFMGMLMVIRQNRKWCEKFTLKSGNVLAMTSENLQEFLICRLHPQVQIGGEPSDFQNLQWDLSTEIQYLTTFYYY